MARKISTKPRSHLKASMRRALKNSEFLINSDLRFNHKARFYNALMVFKINCKHWRVWCNRNLKGLSMFSREAVKKLEIKVATMVIKRHFHGVEFSPCNIMFKSNGSMVQE